MREMPFDRKANIYRRAVSEDYGDDVVLMFIFAYSAFVNFRMRARCTDAKQRQSNMTEDRVASDVPDDRLR